MLEPKGTCCEFAFTDDPLQSIFVDPCLGVHTSVLIDQLVDLPVDLGSDLFSQYCLISELSVGPAFPDVLNFNILCLAFLIGLFLG